MTLRRELCAVLLTAALMAFAWLLVSRLESANSGAEGEYVTDAVRSAALTCYAAEGAYPRSLDYLRENYGLAYDESRYMVTYDAFASNLMPDIYVTEVEADTP